jgi:hypothetical protein
MGGPKPQTILTGMSKCLSNPISFIHMFCFAQL